MGGALSAVLACGGAADEVAERPVLADSQVSGSDTASATSRTPRPRVVILGTSLTAGLGLEPAEAYPAVLQQLADSAGLAVEIVNAGLSGETSAGALRRIEWLMQQPAALLVIETGANDGLRGIEPSTTAANLRGIIAAARAAHPGVPIALVAMEAPPNLGAAYTDRFRRVFSEAAAEAGATLLPFLLQEVAGRAELNQSDGIHPTAEGAARAARTLWPALEPLLRRTASPP